jgi:hypothetical protein
MKNKIIINYIMGFENKIVSLFGKIKLPKSISNISTYNGMLHNKILLYAVFVFSLLNLFLWTNTGDYTYITVFILIGFICSFFSKNMIVILLLSLILTNILKYGSDLKEGFEEGVDGDEEKKDEKEGLEDDEKEGLEDDEKEGLEDNEKEGLEDDEKEGLEDDEREGLEDDEKEGLKDLKKNAKELLTTISGLNEKIKEFSKFDFTK